MRKLYQILMILILIVLTACKNNSDTKLEFSEEFRNLTWEFTEEGQGSDDFFLEFRTNELFFTDNFQGDCYYRSKATLVDKNDDKYTIEENVDGEIEGSSAYIKVENDELWISGTESYQTKEVYIQSIRSASSFEPKCEDSPIK